MVRMRFITEVRYGHFAEYLSAMEELNAVASARGWKPMQWFVPAAGRANEIIGEVDYDSFADYERESNAFYGDAECMKIIRSTNDMVVQGSGRTELLESAPHLA